MAHPRLQILQTPPTAIIQLAQIRRLGVVTDEELGRFSPGTREVVNALVTGDFGD